jgi:hypothetical protein
MTIVTAWIHHQPATDCARASYPKPAKQSTFWQRKSIMRLLNLILAAACLILAGASLAAWMFGHIDHASGLFCTGASLFCAAIARTQPEID